ncbi:hypothetical protein, partial [Arthrobacter koreensis]|uniref:hypothetical protein n=1 Tax=Arthrobacter koreensis TaxID=199136 RepID=UPI002DBD309D
APEAWRPNPNFLSMVDLLRALCAGGKPGTGCWVRKGLNSRFGWNSSEFTELLKRPGWNMLVKHHSGAKRK